MVFNVVLCQDVLEVYRQMVAMKTVQMLLVGVAAVSQDLFKVYAFSKRYSIGGDDNLAE